MIHPNLASIFRSGRAEFNARFAAARHVHPDLDAAAFSDFLQTAVDDLVRAVDQVRPDRVAEVTMSAYDVALELVSQKLAGSGSRLAPVDQGWRRILPASAALVATAPGRLIAAVCNAVHQLASTPGARPTQWIETMATLAPQCADAEAFLKLGQVAAWRAGLAHFRAGALAAAEALPEPLALATFGVRSGISWAQLRERLLVNPWFDPATDSAVAEKEGKGLRVVAQPGSFRGYGGLFVVPPLVASTGDHIFARSDNACWLLTADVFGATFHRAALEDFEVASREQRLPPGLQVKGTGIALNGKRVEFPALGDVTSTAANSTTLALTSQLTHSIVLVALN
jgi:hypothetical protein